MGFQIVDVVSTATPGDTIHAWRRIRKPINRIGIVRMTRKSFSWIDVVPVTISTVLFISQIVVGIYSLTDVSQIQILAYIGVGLYVFSGLVFGGLPVFEFRKKGGVKKGKSYIHTTRLVDTGIYSVVRHPQYVTFMLWAIAGMLLFQHWIIILLGFPIIPLTYFDLIKAYSVHIVNYN